MLGLIDWSAKTPKRFFLRLWKLNTMPAPDRGIDNAIFDSHD